MRKQVTIKTLPTEHRKMLGFLLSACVIRKIVHRCKSSTKVLSKHARQHSYDAYTLSNLSNIAQWFVTSALWSLKDPRHTFDWDKVYEVENLFEKHK